MIKNTQYRQKNTHKKRIDPLFMAVLAMLIFIPIINACSSTPKPTKTKINTANLISNDLKLPDGYEWDGEDDESEDDDLSISSFQQGTATSFRADKNAPTSTRLEAIENQLTLLRNDFNELYPSMRRLMAIEQDMQELIMELKSLTTDVAAQAPMTGGLSQNLTKEEALARADELKRRAQQGDNLVTQPTGFPQASPTQQPPLDLSRAETPPPPTPAALPPTITPEPVAASAPAASGPINATVTGMRIGIHSDIVRVVLDYTNGSLVNFEQAAGDRQFTLTLPSTLHNGRKTWTSEYVPMVTSYSVQQNGSNAQVSFNLEPGVFLKSAFIIPPKSAGQNPRLVVDFSE